MRLLHLVARLDFEDLDLAPVLNDVLPWIYLLKDLLFLVQLLVLRFHLVHVCARDVAVEQRFLGGGTAEGHREVVADVRRLVAYDHWAVLRVLLEVDLGWKQLIVFSTRLLATQLGLRDHIRLVHVQTFIHLL